MSFAILRDRGYFPGSFPGRFRVISPFYGAQLGGFVISLNLKKAPMNGHTLIKSWASGEICPYQNPEPSPRLDRDASGPTSCNHDIKLAETPRKFPAC